MLICNANQMSATVLNAMMTSMHNNDVPDKIFNLRGNTGADDCDRNIAGKKGWTENEDIGEVSN
jgi:hypothetical protein